MTVTVTAMGPPNQKSFVHLYIVHRTRAGPVPNRIKKTRNRNPVPHREKQTQALAGNATATGKWTEESGLCSQKEYTEDRRSMYARGPAKTPQTGSDSEVEKSKPTSYGNDNSNQNQTRTLMS